MARPIPLSFKENENEIKMYEYVKSKSSPSAYIKELISKDMSGIEPSLNKKQPDDKQQENKKSNSINLSALKGVGR